MSLFIEITLCLTLIYALGAMICSVLHESVAQLLSLRWRNLDRALRAMLAPPDYARFMAHPLIADVWDRRRKPTVIPDLIAARALVHAYEPATLPPLTDAAALLASLPAGVQRRVVPFLRDTAPDLPDLYQAAQAWFNTAMSAASDWYARQAHWLSLCVALVFACALNIDTFAIATRLANAPAERAELVQLAQQLASAPRGAAGDACADVDPAATPELRFARCVVLLGAARADLVGWRGTTGGQLFSTSFGTRLLGWLVSALAMSLGARFWFDVLSHLVSMRAGLTPEVADGTARKAA